MIISYLRQKLANLVSTLKGDWALYCLAQRIKRLKFVADISFDEFDRSNKEKIVKSYKLDILSGEDFSIVKTPEPFKIKNYPADYFKKNPIKF